MTWISGMTWVIVRSLRLSHDRATAIGSRKRDDPGGADTSRMEAWIRGLESEGFETYYPMVRELRRVPRRELSKAQRDCGVTLMRPRVVAFLPGFVFVVDSGRLRFLASHPGVIGFVSVAGEPARISDWSIEQLRAREREGDGAIPGGTPIELIFRKGDAVRVINGPFTDQQGIVAVPPSVPLEDIDTSTRLRLSVGQFSVDLTVADVRKI
jgi:transcription antitermination factor NusG